MTFYFSAQPQPMGLSSEACDLRPMAAMGFLVGGVGFAPFEVGKSLDYPLRERMERENVGKSSATSVVWPLREGHYEPCFIHSLHI